MEKPVSLDDTRAVKVPEPEPRDPFALMSSELAERIVEMVEHDRERTTRLLRRLALLVRHDAPHPVDALRVWAVAMAGAGTGMGSLSDAARKYKATWKTEVTKQALHAARGRGLRSIAHSWGEREMQAVRTLYDVQRVDELYDLQKGREW